MAQSDPDCKFSLSGQVIDEHDHSNLSFSTVYLIELNQGVVADSTGEYKLSNLCKGRYTVVVSHVSCRPDTLSVNLTKDTRLNFFLEHHAEYLHQITIHGLDLQSNSSDQQHKLDLNRLDNYSFQSLGDVLERIPGVSSLKTGSHVVKPVVQGLYGSRVVTVNHGVRMQDMEWGDEHASMIEINSADQVTLVSGGSALRYGGDAVAGLIVLQPSKIPDDTLFASTLINGASNGWGGSVSSELVKSWKSGWYTKVQGALKRSGDFKAPDYQLTNTGFYDKGLSLTAGRQINHGNFDLYYSYFNTEIGILSASHIGSIEDLLDAINSREPTIIEDFSYKIGLPRQQIGHHLVRLQFEKHTGIGDWHWQYDFQQNQRFEFDKRLGENQDRPSIDLKLSTHTLSGSLYFNENGNLPAEVGIIYRYQNNFANPETGVRRLIPDYHKNEVGSYLSGKYQVNSKLELDAGLRYDFNRIDAMKFYQKSRWEERGYQQDFSQFVVREFPTQLLTNPVFNYHNFAYTAGALYCVNAGSEIRFNYFFTKRSPNPSELFSDGLHHGAARIELGDLRVKPESSHKIGLSYIGRQGIFNWDVNSYFSRIDQFILPVPTGVELTIRGVFPVWEYQQTNTRIWGVDGQLTANWHSNWRSHHMVRYIHGQDLVNDQPLINIPAPRINNSLVYTSTSWKSLSIEIASIYTFRQHRYPENNFLVFIPESNAYEELDISTPPDGYHLFNVHASSKIISTEKLKLRLGLGFSNLFNNNYRDYLNRLRYFADDPGRSFEITLKLEY
ncbi:MAG: TonB-dependent receptor [Cyclobacteriaceae bacterium]|nr:MAG: TonB-dependent receptor [Cyclobacteriaceae bacterium]